MDLPPEPAPASELPPPPPSRTRRRTVAIAVAILGVIVVGVVVAIIVSRGDGFPDRVLGYQRLHGGAAERAERVMESIRIDDLELNAAVYGEGGTPRLVAVIYGNYPAGVDIDVIVDGMARGMKRSGGRVEKGSLEKTGGPGNRFACVEASGPGLLVPGGPDEAGVACVFQGASTGLVITTHSSRSDSGLRDARAFYDAYRSA